MYSSPKSRADGVSVGPEIASGPPGTGTHPKNPPPLVLLPAIGVQLRSPVPPYLLSASQVSTIEGALKQMFVKDYPNLQPVAVNRDAEGSDAATFVGIWLWEPYPTLAEALTIIDQNIPLLSGLDTFGVFVNGSFIDALTQQAFDLQPKVNGSIELSAIDVTLVPPNTVQTTLTGIDTAPVPDAGFTLTVTDIVGIETTGGTGYPMCVTSNHLSVDQSWFDELIGILTSAAFLSAVWSPIFWLPFIAFAVELGYVSSIQSLTSAPGGAGSGAIKLLPTAVPLPKGAGEDANAQDLNFSYTTAQVIASGIYATGTNSFTDRKPTVKIEGPTSLALSPEAHGSFTAIPHDLRPDLSYKWSAAGSMGQGAQTTGIFFNARPAVPGSVQSTQVSVVVTDQDGLTASAALAVELLTPESSGVHKPGFPGGPGS